MSVANDLERRADRGTVRGADEVWLRAAVDAAHRRRRIPFWAVPVIVIIPLWAIIFAGGLSPSSTGAVGQLEQGRELFASRCAGCHGAAGQGASGRPMSGGSLVETFPDLVGQLQFVWTGSRGVGPAGTPYGDPARPGGQHTTYGFGGGEMPAFAGSLTQAGLLAVVRYEREVLSGRTVGPGQLDGDGRLRWPDGSPMLDATGTLVTPDGRPLFDADGHLSVDPDWSDPIGGSG